MLMVHVLWVCDIDSISFLGPYTHTRAYVCTQYTHAHAYAHWDPSSLACTCYVVLSFHSGMAARDSSCHLLPVTSRYCEPSALLLLLRCIDTDRKTSHNPRHGKKIVRSTPFVTGIHQVKCNRIELLVDGVTICARN